MSICPQGCGLQICSEILEEHLRFTCDFRHVMCEFCFKSYVTSKRQEHTAECPMFPISCPYGCGLEGVARNQMRLHVRDCCLRRERCRYVHLGCEYEGHRGKDFEAHQDDMPLHFEMVANLYMNLHLRFDVFYHSTRALILELQNQYLILQTSLDDNSKQLRRLQRSKKAESPKYNGQNNSQLGPENQIPTQPEPNCDKIVEDLKRHIAILTDRVKALEESATAAAIKDQDIEDQSAFDAQQPMDDARLLGPRKPRDNYTGVLDWKIRNYSRLKGVATYHSVRPRGMYSRAFYSSRYGYRMCGEMHVNGNGEGYSTHLSLYLVIMKGPHDNFLPWPFSHRVLFTLVGTRGKGSDVQVVLFPDPKKAAYQKPISASNPKVGFDEFVSHVDLEYTDYYLQDDSFRVKIVVGNPATNEA